MNKETPITIAPTLTVYEAQLIRYALGKCYCDASRQAREASTIDLKYASEEVAKEYKALNDKLQGLLIDELEKRKENKN